MTVGNQGNAVRWNGSTWKSFSLNHQIKTFSFLSCPSTKFCMTIGPLIKPANIISETYIWNGSTWKKIPSPNQANEVYSLSCPSTKLCLAGSGSKIVEFKAA